METDAEKQANAAPRRISLDELKAGKARGRNGMMLAVGGVIAVLVAVIVFLLVSRKEPSAGPAAAPSRQEFPVTEYLNNPGALAGNRYTAVLKVDAQLGYDQSHGRLLSFLEESSQKVVPVLVPPALDLTFNKGQVYRLSFKVMENGVLYAESIQKH